MSLSQKYSGKVLVPWFNNDEWLYVSNILKGRKSESYRNVLNILKIWKTRIPLLSAGVEGTLIILDALLSNEMNLSTLHLTQVYAISTMRFLNLCAANNERQGTFNRTVQRNDLPRWLINVRHDIAHDHKLPSKSILELSLIQSLEWLIEKYWSVQIKTMSDYIVREPAVECDISILLNLYIKLIRGIHFHKNINEVIAAFKKLDYVTTDHEKLKSDKYAILNILENKIKQSVREIDQNLYTIVDLLMGEDGMLSTPENLTEQDPEILPISFRNMWSNLLNILFENCFLQNLFKKFIEVTNDKTFSEKTRLIASWWIYEIFLGLRKSEAIVEKNLSENTHKYQNDVNSLIFLDETSLKKIKMETEKLEEKALSFPNNYTLNYLEEMLKFNKNSEDFISDIKMLVEDYVSVKTEICQYKLFTTNDLDDNFCNNADQDMEIDIEDNNCAWTNDGNNVHPTNRWSEVKNKASFTKCPLGVMPQQNREINPLINFERWQEAYPTFRMFSKNILLKQINV